MILSGTLFPETRLDIAERCLLKTVPIGRVVVAPCC